MKAIITLLCLFSALVFTLPACNKNDGGDDTPAKTKTQLISQSSWKYSSATVGGADASPFIQACQKDNILIFAAAGTGTVDEGTTKCDDGDPQTNPFTWSFATGETVLNVSTVLFTGGSNTFTIVTLSETQLVLSGTINFGIGNQTVIVTFVH